MSSSSGSGRLASARAVGRLLVAALALGASAGAAHAQVDVEVSWGESDFSIREGYSRGLTVLAEGQSENQAWFWNVVTHHGGATEDDYAFSGVWVINPGARQQVVYVRTIDDDLDDDCEVVEVRLTSPLTGNPVGDPLRIRIIDNDGVAVDCGWGDVDSGGGAPPGGGGGGPSLPEPESEPEPDPDPDPPTVPCERHIAPYWHGEAVLVLRSANARSVEVEATCGGETASHTEFGELIIREAHCMDADGAPRVGSLTVTGAEPGGWYYVRGDRNVAVAPLMCASLLEGETVEATAIAGVTATRSAHGTLVRHDTAGFIGIIPDLPAGREGSLRAPFWRGWGGLVGRAANGEYVDISYGCGIVPLRQRLSADPDTGIVSALLRPSNCKSEDGRLFPGGLSVSGMEDGGWYWLSGTGIPAAAPLVRFSLLDEDLIAVDPLNEDVKVHRHRKGTLLEDTRTGLSGVVPHLDD